ncbi:MAG: hypothetical protein ACI4JJ_09085 [Huintestinicola sp.]
MANYGISSYLSNMKSFSSNTNMYLSRTYTSSMLARAYKMAAKANRNNQAASKPSSSEDSSSKLNKYEELLNKINDSTSSEDNRKAVSSNSMKLFTSAATLLSKKNTSAEDFAKNVKDFADNYNNTVNTLKKSDDGLSVSSGIHMVNTTRSFSGALSKAGITVNDDNTISVDEAKLKDNADYAKTLFNGSYSFGGKIAKKASEIQTISTFSGAGIYNRYGIFNSSY